MGSVGIDDCCCNTKRLSRNGFCLCKTTETEYVTFAALRIDSLKHALFFVRLSCDSKTTSSLTVRYCCIGCDQIYMVPVIYTVSTVYCKAAIIHHVISGFLGVVLIALAAGGIFYAFAKQKQKKQAEKEALDPDANYTEDKGDFEIPTDMPDEGEAPDEQDTEPI